MITSALYKTVEDQQSLNAAYAARVQRGGLLSVKVTPFYQKKIDEEVAALGHTHGPLHRAMYPSADKLYLRAPGEVDDWVDDRSNMESNAEGVFIQKYPDRVLFTPTSTCAAHCLYCFRQDVLAHEKQRKQPSLDEKIALLQDHLRRHEEVKEVILSGGDPLVLSYIDLEKILLGIRQVPSVEHIRIHSRAPIFAPAVLKDDAKLDLMARHNVRFLFHIIHPYEICGEVEELIGRMNRAGIRLYNHFPLLRSINDHADVLLMLMEKLERLNVKTLSIYVPEPIRYSAAYRVSYMRMSRLMDEVVRRSPSWLNAFRFCLDTPHGKVRRENLVMRENATHTLVFMRDGKRITYPDFPEELDVAGDRATLLWREARAA